MTATQINAPEWTSLAERRPQYSAYEVSHRGLVRSLDRQLPDGRQVKGRVLKATVSGKSPYPKVTLYDDAGKAATFHVHSLVLLVYVGECPDGQEALHGNDDPLDNRWPENLAYGTHPENVVQRMLNRPAAPKPVKVCVRCDRPFEGNGRRCHDCVVQLGELAAFRLADGADLEEVAEELGYPSPPGIWKLAVRYGGLVVLTAEEINRQLQEAADLGQRQPLLRSVMTTLRTRFRRGDAA